MDFFLVLSPIIYFSPFVTPKTAILLLKGFHIPELDFASVTSNYINAYRTTPSVSILSKQE